MKLARLLFILDRLRAFAMAAVFAAIGARAFGATMPVSWSPVTDGSASGYTIYTGTAPGAYTQTLDAGNTTSSSLGGLTDCTRYYVAVKAYNASGVQSAGYSNEISGLPSIVVTAIDPPAASPGQTATLTLSGSNFAPGASVVSSDPRLTVVSSSYIACTSLQAVVTIVAGAASGPVALRALNSDGSAAHTGAALQILAPAPAPTISAIAPPDSATGVAFAVHPTVTFGQTMNPATITAATVRLLGPGSAPVAQASGSPVLDATGRIAMIVPAQSLAYDTLYQVQIIGSTSGVATAQGGTMAGSYEQLFGFKTAPASSTPPTIVSSMPPDGSKYIPVTVHPTVTFSAAMAPSSIMGATVRLLGPDGLPVAQSQGSPALDATGTIATITPQAPLAEKSWFQIQVIGGTSGVRSVAGTPMAGEFRDATGFQIENLPPGDVTGVRGKGHR